MVINARSTYPVKFKVKSVTSSDKRFIVNMANKEISPDERIEIAEIIFDASKMEDNYLSV